MKQIKTKEMHPYEAIIEMLALILSVDFNSDEEINGSVEFNRCFYEENGKNEPCLKVKNITFHREEVAEEEEYTTVIYKDRIETNIPATNEGMKKAKKVLKEYVEGMFTIFYAQRKDNNNE